MSRLLPFALALLLVVGGAARPAADPPGSPGATPARASTTPATPAQDASDAAFQKPIDTLLDAYVRDGYVYYAALKSDRARLDRYIASLDGPSAAGCEGWPRERQAAFWIDAYNAFVLRTVIDHYPIRGRAAQYPSNSIRQIPGAFERLPHRAAGRTVTLDDIENKILPGFHDPRLYLVLGRGAVGSGRLRSEAYLADKLEAQVKSMTEEIVQRPEMVRIHKAGNQIAVTAIVGWHEAEFAQAYGASVEGLEQRSPIERAVVALLKPALLPSERDLVGRNQWTLSYLDFDWHLNDLTDRYR
jgi:hypothetical protein